VDFGKLLFTRETPRNLDPAVYRSMGLLTGNRCKCAHLVYTIGVSKKSILVTYWL